MFCGYIIFATINSSHTTQYIARRLLEINERGTWKDPSQHPSQALLVKQDEEIFQIARLCNCGWFAAIIFSDYLSCILGLVRQGSTWSLEPFDQIRDIDHQIFERGRGNACSVEFNCLYRWHATTSIEDEEWVTQQFRETFPGKKPEEVTVQDFFQTAAKLEKKAETDFGKWTFGKSVFTRSSFILMLKIRCSLQRQTEGPNVGAFKDSDLANLLMNAFVTSLTVSLKLKHPFFRTSQHAAAFGARGTPSVMRLHEIMGIEANRSWGVCSLNDFRKFLGLKSQ